MKKILSRLFNNSFNSPAQKTKKWMLQRSGKICASEVSGLIGKNPYTNINSSIKNKLYGKHVPNKYTLFGEKYEKIARDIHSIKENVITIELNFLTDNEYKILGASPDGLCFRVINKSKTEFILREIKRILENKQIFIELKEINNKIKIIFNQVNIDEYIDKLNENEILEIFLIEIKCPSTTEVKDDYIPKQYRYQMLTQMSVCKVVKCNFVNNKFIEVNFDEFIKSDKISGIILKYYDTKTYKNSYYYPELNNYYYLKNNKIYGYKNRKLNMMKEIMYFMTMSESCNYELSYWILSKQCIIPYIFDEQKFNFMIETLLETINSNNELNKLITEHI